MVRHLLILNGLAIVGAVVNHAIHWSITGMFWWTDRYRPVSVPNYDQLGGVTFWAISVLDQCAVVAVPAFLFVSGIFASLATGRTRNHIGWAAVLHRIGSLLPPYLFWSFGLIAITLLQGQRYTFTALIHVLIQGKVAAPYYYVPLLVQCYLLAPFIIPLARKSWKVLLGGAILAQILVMASRGLFLLKVAIPGLDGGLAFVRNWQLLDQGVWFLAGIAAGLHLSAFKKLLIRYRRVVLGLLVVSFLAGMAEWEVLRRISGKPWIAPQTAFVFERLFAVCLLASYLSFERFASAFPRHVEIIGARSYGIYLSHLPVLEASARAVYHFAPWLLAYQSLFLPLLVVAGTGVPLLLMAAVRKSPARRCYGYLFG